jgi:hypothetical protein
MAAGRALWFHPSVLQPRAPQKSVLAPQARQKPLNCTPCRDGRWLCIRCNYEEGRFSTADYAFHSMIADFRSTVDAKIIKMRAALATRRLFSTARAVNQKVSLPFSISPFSEALDRHAMVSLAPQHSSGERTICVGGQFNVRGRRVAAEPWNVAR